MKGSYREFTFFEKTHSFYLTILVADSSQIPRDHPHAVCCRHWYSLIPPDCNPSSWSHFLTQIQFSLHSSQQRKIHPKPAKPKKRLRGYGVKREKKNTHTHFSTEKEIGNIRQLKKRGTE